MRSILLIVAAVVLAAALGIGCGGGSSAPLPVWTPSGEDESMVTSTTWDDVVGGDIPAVMPGVFRIGNVSPGDTIDDWPADAPELGFSKGDPIAIIIYNNKDTPTPYSVTFALPHDPADGYESAPPDAARWVIIGDPMPIVPARGTLTVPIIIYIPKKADVPDRWEFAIAVSDASQDGWIRTEMRIRWLIDMG